MICCLTIKAFRLRGLLMCELYFAVRHMLYIKKNKPYNHHEKIGLFMKERSKNLSYLKQIIHAFWKRV